jgi:ankyrin repeat protein
MKSPIHIAVEKGAPEILDILLKHNSNANESRANDELSLLSFVIAKGDADIIDRRLKAGAAV